MTKGSPGRWADRKIAQALSFLGEGHSKAPKVQRTEVWLACVSKQCQGSCGNCGRVSQGSQNFQVWWAKGRGVCLESHEDLDFCQLWSVGR